MGADGVEDARLEERLAGEDLAGVGMVDPEALALQERAAGADRVLAGDRVELRFAEGERHDELAEVVEQAGEVRRLGVGPARSARAPATAATWLAWTCSSPREAPPVPGRELEEAAHGGLEGEAPDARHGRRG